MTKLMHWLSQTKETERRARKAARVKRIPPPSAGDMGYFQEELKKGQGADSVRLAHGCMRVADNHAQNWDLSESEMETFLKHGVFHDFYTWMTDPIVNEDGTQTNRFRDFDLDHEGSLGEPELYIAMRSYLQQPPVTWEAAVQAFPPREAQSTQVTGEAVVCEADLGLIARHMIRKTDPQGDGHSYATPTALCGQLSHHELQAFLTGERYRDFLEWLETPPRVGGATRFTSYDHDKSGRIGYEELQVALADWTGQEVPAWIEAHWEGLGAAKQIRDDKAAAWLMGAPARAVQRLKDEELQRASERRARWTRIYRDGHVYKTRGYV
jgi:hypothetical protein